MSEKEWDEAKYRRLLDNTRQLRQNYILQMKSMFDLEWTIRRKQLGSTNMDGVEMLRAEVKKSFLEDLKILTDILKIDWPYSARLNMRKPNEKE